MVIVFSAWILDFLWIIYWVLEFDGFSLANWVHEGEFSVLIAYPFVLG